MKAKKLTNWQKVRKFFNDVHLWAGLSSGLIVFAVCFSGTIYTYNTELTEWSASHLHRATPGDGTEKLAIDQLLAQVTADVEGSVRRIQIPADPKRTYRFAVHNEGERSRFGTTYFVDPYTGTVLGTSEDQSQTRIAVFMRSLFSLHRWLMLDRIEEPLIGDLPNRKLGSYITGTATILFTLGVFTGLIIWFPKKIRTWRQGLRIKWRAGWKRVNHDLHNTLAFYSLILLLLMGITGPQWSFPWYRDGLQKMLGTDRKTSSVQQSREAKPAGNDQAAPKTVELGSSLSFEHLLARCDEALPYRGDYTINLSDDDILTIRKNRIGFFAPAASDEIKIEASTGVVRDVNRFRDKPLNERIAGSIKALHIGDVYGPFTKLLYFFACLIATSLPVTGTLIWINKMKKKPSRPKRRLKRAARH